MEPFLLLQKKVRGICSLSRVCFRGMRMKMKEIWTSWSYFIRNVIIIIENYYIFNFESNFFNKLMPWRFLFIFLKCRGDFYFEICWNMWRKELSWTNFQIARVDTVNPVTKKCKAKMRAATIEKGGMNKLRATYNAIDSINEPWNDGTVARGRKETLDEKIPSILLLSSKDDSFLTVSNF